MLPAASATQERVQCLAEVLPLPFSSFHKLDFTKRDGENRKSFKGKTKVSKVKAKYRFSK